MTIAAKNGLGSRSSSRRVPADARRAVPIGCAPGTPRPASGKWTSAGFGQGTGRLSLALVGRHLEAQARCGRGRDPLENAGGPARPASRPAPGHRPPALHPAQNNFAGRTRPAGSARGLSRVSRSGAGGKPDGGVCCCVCGSVAARRLDRLCHRRDAGLPATDRRADRMTAGWPRAVTKHCHARVRGDGYFLRE